MTVEWQGFGKLLILFGVALAILGVFLAWGPKIPWIGRLPGDLSFGGEHWRVYIPLGTSLLLSLLLTGLFWLFKRN
ncbi:MAG: DUF2905 domain-containing protein [Candidatus Eisenbacteria bacterium]|uniref:DUF2905 domain-containing protein n=1 Tax=Eiseniibacteriota bacterium TaxID=2212470 RepID=A0A538T738_UNCEI|nr:MAG: DUF2905 domain-containing protein [Candidatus Eisenbacteria bacterium]